MITLLKMPALFLGMLAVFCCLGSFFIRENRYESGHLGETVLFGFIAYYFLFELISVPMMVLGAKLHLLVWVWAAVLQSFSLFLLPDAQRSMLQCQNQESHLLNQQ